MDFLKVGFCEMFWTSQCYLGVQSFSFDWNEREKICYQLKLMTKGETNELSFSDEISWFIQYIQILPCNLNLKRYLHLQFKKKIFSFFWEHKGDGIERMRQFLKLMRELCNKSYNTEIWTGSSGRKLLTQVEFLTDL